MSDAERSASRGRPVFQSTGRGGVGNIRQSSLSSETRSESGPDDFSVTRGREPREPVDSTKIFSTGRGGAGNFRSPSLDVQKSPILVGIEEDVIRQYKISQEDAPVSSGRGGLGNINRSRSRDPAAGPAILSTGRGGVGNIVASHDSVSASIDEDDLKKCHATHDGHYSTSRGGNVNITSTESEPTIEHDQQKSEYQSTGRGGVGNIVTEKPTSRSRD